MRDKKRLLCPGEPRRVLLGFSTCNSTVPANAVPFFFLFLPCCAACEILVSQLEIEPGLSAVKAQRPNHSNEVVELQITVMYLSTLRVSFT